MKKIFVTLLAAAALVACNKNETSPVEPVDDIIRFSSNFQTYTVKSTALDNQTVKIVAGAPINKTVNATAADGKLTPATELRWEKDQTMTTTFVSVYPATIELSETNTVDNYDLLYNGSQDFDFHSAVLTAVAKDVTPKATVNFTYKHPFAQLIITVDNKLEGTPAITNVNVSDVALAGTLNMVAETVTPSETLGNVNATLKDGKYGVVIMPQSAKPVLNITIGEKNYKFVLDAAINFVANKRYNATVTIKDNTPVVEEGEAVSFGFTVVDWETAEDAINFKEEEPVADTWGVVGLGGDWDTDIALAEGETAGILEASISYKASDKFKLRANGKWDVNAGLKEGVTKVGDDKWDGFLTQNGSDIQLEAAGVYTVTFNPETWAFTATKTADLPAEPAAETVSLTVNVYNGAGWENVKLYAWNGETKLSAEWPGDAPAAEDVVVGENHFKSFVFAEWPKNVETCKYILNDGGTNQTADLDCGDVKQDATIYLWLKADKTVEFIADPTKFDPTAVEPEPAVTWVVVGLATDWNTEHVMTQDTTDPNLWTIDVTLGAADAEPGFKFRTQGDTEWKGHQFGMDPAGDGAVTVPEQATEVTVNLVADNGGSKNIVLRPAARQYTFKLYVAGDKKGEFTAVLK